MIRTKVSEIRETGRNAQGVRLMNVDDGERVVAIDAFEEAESEPNGSSMPPLAADGGLDGDGVNGSHGVSGPEGAPN
jgi:DNA gyrase subunit A